MKSYVASMWQIVTEHKPLLRNKELLQTVITSYSLLCRYIFNQSITIQVLQRLSLQRIRFNTVKNIYWMSKWIELRFFKELLFIFKLKMLTRTCLQNDMRSSFLYVVIISSYIFLFHKITYLLWKYMEKISGERIRHNDDRGVRIWNHVQWIFFTCNLSAFDFAVTCCC